MKLVLFLFLLITPLKGEIAGVKTDVSLLRPPSTTKEEADTTKAGGKLAKALERLQSTSQQEHRKGKYRLVPLLGGKLVARVPIS